MILTSELPQPTLWRVLLGIRAMVVFITGMYAVGLMGYLFLRLVIGDGVWWLGLLNNFAPYYFLPLVGLIPLMALVRQGRVAVVLLPLALIGALWVAPYYVPKAPITPTHPTLTIVTFNVWGANQRLSEVIAWLREKQADLILLQEVPGRFTEAGIPELIDLYPHQMKRITGLSQTTSWGNMLLSRRPITRAEDFDLEGTGVPTQQKVILAVDEQSIAIYNIHLLMPIGDAPRFTRIVGNGQMAFALRYDDQARNAQIARFLPMIEAETLPYIVAGDFNMSDQAVIYAQFASRMTDTFRERGNGFGASWPISTIAGFSSLIPPLLRIDYIWHSPHFRAVSVAQGPELGSDHLPLYATFELLFDAP